MPTLWTPGLAISCPLWHHTGLLGRALGLTLHNTPPHPIDRNDTTCRPQRTPLSPMLGCLFYSIKPTTLRNLRVQVHGHACVAPVHGPVLGAQHQSPPQAPRRNDTADPATQTRIRAHLHNRVLPPRTHCPDGEFTRGALSLSVQPLLPGLHSHSGRWHDTGPAARISVSHVTFVADRSF